ncbi:hypothetical protein [Dubosiella muris]|uniref:Uncharacterized protein n=1 Tax=Dubosiella muris TaxID=3038133 RepID=A0AC61R6F3_9FIRM|nr:hypothetical protein [Dubosiella muris]TGY65470.1 hypothetical protein E5336_08625 [Dubosiella muris]
MRCRKEKKRKGWRWLLLFPVVIGLAGVFLFYFVFAIPSSEGMSLASWPARFTENFALFLETKDSEIVLTPAGKNQIETYGLWAQVLDKNNTEILSVNKPSSLTAHYTSAQLPIQIASSVIPYDWTFARLALCAFGLATLVLCALIAFTLWLSVRVENPYVTLLVLAGCLFIPAFIAPTGATGLFNKVLFLTPYRALNMEIGKYVTYSMGKFVCDLATTRALVSLLALVLGVAGAKRAWRARE